MCWNDNLKNDRTFRVRGESNEVFDINQAITSSIPEPDSHYLRSSIWQLYSRSLCNPHIQLMRWSFTSVDTRNASTNNKKNQNKIKVTFLLVFGFCSKLSGVRTTWICNYFESHTFSIVFIDFKPVILSMFFVLQVL